jgi:hypothetical protein
MQASTTIKLLQDFVGMVKYYRGIAFLFQCTFHQSNRHLSQNVAISYVCGS